MKRLILFNAAAIAITSAYLYDTSSAFADQTCSIPSYASHEGSVSSWCKSTWIAYFWDKYSFDKGNWDDGFGYWDVCNSRKPLARTFNAIDVVNYADGNGSGRSINDFSGNILNWGGNYTMREIDELDAHCADPEGGNFSAMTYYGLGADERTELYLGFFYDRTDVERAAVLVHEARHADHCGHNGNDGSNKCVSRSRDCEETFYDGCADQPWIVDETGRGATAWEVLWLWYFVLDADPFYGTTTRRALARDKANAKLDTKFDVHPCINISSWGNTVWTCSCTLAAQEFPTTRNGAVPCRRTPVY